MKKTKLITFGACATLLASNALTPLMAFAETASLNSSDSTTPSTEVIQSQQTANETTSSTGTSDSTKTDASGETKETSTLDSAKIKPGTRPIKPEAKPDLPEKPTNDTLTQVQKDSFMQQSTLEFQGVTYSYTEFLRFADSLNQENYTIDTWETMVAAKLAFRKALGQAATEADFPKVKTAAITFSQSVEGLRAKVKSSSKKLEMSIKAVNWASLVKADYTEASWNRLAKIYKVAINVFEVTKTQNLYQEELDTLADNLMAATKALRKKVIATNSVPVTVNLEGDQSFVDAPYKVNQEIGDGITLQIWDAPAQATNLYKYTLYVDGVVAIQGSGTFEKEVLITADTINTGQDSSNGYGNELREVKTDVKLTVTNSRKSNKLDLFHTFKFKRYDYNKTQLFVVDGGAPGVEGSSYVKVTYTEFGVRLEYSENGSIIDSKTNVAAETSSYTFNYMNYGVLGRLTIQLDFTDSDSVDKTGLEKLLYLISSTIDLDLYTSESVESLLTALMAAMTVLNNSEATAPQITEVETALTKALNNLQLEFPEVFDNKLDTSQLLTQIALAKSKEQQLYTSSSWGEMLSSLDVAETVLRYSDFKNIENQHTARSQQVNVNVTQSMIKTATDNLTASITNLALASGPANNGSGNDGDGNNNSNNNQQTNNSSDTANNTAKADSDTLSKTNVSLGAMPAIGGVGTTTGALLAFLKSRKTKAK